MEVPLEDLKEGENKIGSAVIEKIKPMVLCRGQDLKGFQSKFIGFTYSGIQREEGYYELACNIEDKAKVKMIGWEFLGSNHFNIESFSVFDMDENVIDKHEDVEFFSPPTKVKLFHHYDKTYFLIYGIGYKGKFGEYFLYVIDEEENVKPITSWRSEGPLGSGALEYALGHRSNLYLKVEGKIWEIGKDDVLKNKFSANKIIIEDNEISFE